MKRTKGWDCYAECPVYLARSAASSASDAAMAFAAVARLHGLDAILDQAAPHCKKPEHKYIKLICPACISGGAAGGRVRSQAKAKSSRANGKLGGRPRLPPHSIVLHAAFEDKSFRKVVDGCERCDRAVSHQPPARPARGSQMLPARKTLAEGRRS